GIMHPVNHSQIITLGSPETALENAAPSDEASLLNSKGVSTMQKALIVLVEDNRTALELAEKELRKRYGADYEVCCFCSSAEAMADLQQRREAEAEVALFLASCWMTEMK